jgi:diguanylate cyclase (GGDEF)-like protein
VEILLVEDDKTNRLLIERRLTKLDHQICAVDSAEEALKQLKKHPFPMLFLDIGLPGMSGIELIRTIRRNESEAQTPIYILVGTGKTGEADLREILDAGADDYVAKPFRLDILDTRLVVAANSVEILRERSRLRRDLIYLAEHDPLTGILNRRQLDSLLKAAIHSERETVLLQLDLDHFKQINDECGHEVGDEHLKQVARLIGDFLPESTKVVRLGGDEFVALVEGMNVREAFARAEKIISSIRGLQVGDGNLALRSGASIGLTNVRAGCSAAELLKEADLACYRAKSLGKSCAQIYVPFNPDLFLQENEEPSALSAAQDRLELWFQPVCELNTGKIIFHEALMRFIAGSGNGEVDAGMFMAELTRAENVPALDRFVVGRACSALGQFPDLAVSINIDARSICDWKFVKFLKQNLEGSAISGARLLLEITEVNQIPDITIAHSVIDHLAGLGVRCALDDLGAGFNSITLLKVLPFKLVKVDGRFIANLPDDVYNQCLVGALKHLADGVGFEIVGERIETREEWDEARRLGVSFGQGHLIGAARKQPYRQSEVDQRISLPSIPE